MMSFQDSLWPVPVVASAVILNLRLINGERVTETLTKINNQRVSLFTL